MSSVNTSVDSSTLTLWPCSFPGCLVSFYFWFVEIYELNANSVDPDQMSRSAASDLGLHFLSISHLWDARLIWVQARYLM